MDTNTSSLYSVSVFGEKCVPGYIREGMDHRVSEPLSRIQRLVILLENYSDVLDRGATGGTGEGDSLPLMGREWHHPSYQELVRVLTELRGVCNDLVRHCLGFYSAEWRTTTRLKWTLD
jgi:hypothetical protein